MQERKAIIDVIHSPLTIEGATFVMMDYGGKTESYISKKAAHDYYINGDFKFELEFTENAIDEIQNSIEDELIRQEEFSEAPYASTND